MRNSIYAIFKDTESATKAVGALLDHGVKADDLSILIKSVPTSYGEELDVMSQAEKGLTVTTMDDARAGAVKGAGVGLGLGAVAAIASVVVPGFGLVLGGGALAMAIGGMAGATAAGAIAGGVSGYLVDQGVDPQHVELFTETVTSGGAVVSVSFPSDDVDSQEIRSVLEKYSGVIQPVSPLAQVPPSIPVGTAL